MLGGVIMVPSGDVQSSLLQKIYNRVVGEPFVRLAIFEHIAFYCLTNNIGTYGLPLHVPKSPRIALMMMMDVSIQKNKESIISCERLFCYIYTFRIQNSEYNGTQQQHDDESSKSLTLIWTVYAW